MGAPSDSPSTIALSPRAEARLAEIRADISSRLSPVNTWMNSAAFHELMDEMSLLQLGYELRSGMTRGEIDTRVGPSDRRGASPDVPPSETTPSDPGAQLPATPPGSSTGSE